MPPDENQVVTTSAPTVTGSPASESDVNWTELSGSDDLEVPVDGQLEVPVEAPALPATPEVPATPATPAVPTAPTVPAPAPAEPATPTPPVAPAAPAVPQVTLEQIQAKLVEQYALSPDDALALQTSPETVMPKLAANMHMQIMREAYGQMQQMLQ